ncbi:MAG: hypothetical protein JNM17_13210 [Archangium sp.]|nr:hypothetical protein [Archangium sp.]
MALQLSVAGRNARADAITTAVGNGGKLRILTGSIPANVAAAETGTLLSEHTTASPFAPAASGGVLSPTLPANVNAGNTGTAGYWRLTTSGGTAVLQGTVGTSGADLNINTLSIVAGGPVQVNSWAWTEGGA